MYTSTCISNKIGKKMILNVQSNKYLLSKSTGNNNRYNYNNDRSWEEHAQHVSTYVKDEQMHSFVSVTWTIVLTVQVNLPLKSMYMRMIVSRIYLYRMQFTLVFRMASAKAIAPRKPAKSNTIRWVRGILFLRPKLSRVVSGNKCAARPIIIAI